MPISVAEYLGNRTDVDLPAISPATPGSRVPCPFMSGYCNKLKKRSKPVCSVRKTDGTFYIVCRDRLCSTQKTNPTTQLTQPLNGYQTSLLHNIGKMIFYPNIQLRDIFIKRECSMPVIDRSSYKADYVMIWNNPSDSRGPTKVVLEMQGGGETSNTKILSSLVGEWESNPTSNAKLRRTVNIGTIETNAWRRQQEQFFVKGNIAMQTTKGSALVFCMGSTIYDYVIQKVDQSGLKDLFGYNWTLCLLSFIEDTSQPIIAGPVPLKIDRETRLFTSYHGFVRALTDQGMPCPDLYKGEVIALDGTSHIIP